MKHRLLVITAACAAVCCSIALAQDAPPAATAVGEPARWRPEELALHVRKLEHPLQDTLLPILPWNLPSLATPLAGAYQDKSLHAYARMLAERGIVHPVVMGWRWTPEGALATAKAMHESGLPVHVMQPSLPGGHDKLWPNQDDWIEPWNDGSYGSDKRWPIFPRFDASHAAHQTRANLQPLKDAGIEVAAVWADHEGFPYPWNGAQGAQRRPQARAAYDNPDSLDNLMTFKQLMFELRASLLSAALADPVHALFPNALVGNYGNFLSSPNAMFTDTNGGVYCEGGETLGRLNVIQPVAYANTRLLPRHFNAEQTLTQQDVDEAYFHLMLRTLSTGLANKRSDIKAVPYVSSRVIDDQSDRYWRFGLSRPLFRELLRHGLFRGVNGYWVFNTGYGARDRDVKPLESYQQLDDVVQVYNEALEPRIRPFIERGQPMTFAVPAMRSREVIWSGLRLDDRMLIRVASGNEAAQQVDITLSENESIRLTAPPSGATYLLEPGAVPQQLH